MSPRPLILALTLSLAALCAGAADAPLKFVAYLGATLIDGTGRASPNVIVTQGDRIAAVQPVDGFHAQTGQDVVDVGGKFIIPGLINTHVHLATLADPPVARAYLRRELYSGVTTVRDMAGDARLLVELQREAEFDEIVSPDIVFVALMAGPEFFVDPRSHDAARGRIAGQVPWMQAITPRTDLRLSIAAARGTGASAVKLYGDLPAALVDAITKEAHRQHMLVWAHAALLPAQPSDVVNAGVDVVSHACMLGYELSDPPVPSFEDTTPVDVGKLMAPNLKMPALYENIRRRGIILDATLYTYDKTPSHSCPGDINTELARQAFHAGVVISAGTDDDPDWSDPDSALDTELELMVNKIGMTPAQALASATVIGARVVGQKDTLGTIKVGALANFVVLDKNPTVDIRNIRSVALVVKHGVRHARADYQPANGKDLQ